MAEKRTEEKIWRRTKGKGGMKKGKGEERARVQPAHQLGREERHALPHSWTRAMMYIAVEMEGSCIFHTMLQS